MSAASLPATPLSTPRIVAIVDPISTGAQLAKYLANRGYDLVRVFSDIIPDSVKGLVAEGLEVDWLVTIQHEGRASATARALKGLGVTDVIVGSEPGVTLHVHLAAEFGADLPAEKLELRRNKYLQSEAVRAAGLDAVQQILAHTLDDCEAFIKSVEDLCRGKAGVGQMVTPFKAVVKPVEGAGSDGVTICNSAEAVRAAFAKLEGTKNILGLQNYAVLCQEFLSGTEYVVDTVSRDGVHKVVALWRYDKRDYYGSPVVYHGMRLLNVESDPTMLGPMVSYVVAALETLGIRDGAIHTEIMATPRGPVLVECNCRLHGGEGIWMPISQACLGYTQVSALHDAYFAPQAFDRLPVTPRHPLGKHGAWVTIRSPKEGTISQIHEEKIMRIRALPSFLDEYFAPCISVGSRVRQTVDATTVHGCFNLVHEDAAVLEADYALAQELINEGLFSLETPKAEEADVVRVANDAGFTLTFESVHGQMPSPVLSRHGGSWKTLPKPNDATNEKSKEVDAAMLRQVRRGWRF